RGSNSVLVDPMRLARQEIDRVRTSNLDGRIPSLCRLHGLQVVRHGVFHRHAAVAGTVEDPSRHASPRRAPWPSSRTRASRVQSSMRTKPRSGLELMQPPDPAWLEGRVQEHVSVPAKCYDPETCHASTHLRSITHNQGGEP